MLSDEQDYFYVTDAADEPESIIIASRVSKLGQVFPSDGEVVNIVTLDEHYRRVTDDSLVSTVSEWPCRVSETD